MTLPDALQHAIEEACRTHDQQPQLETRLKRFVENLMEDNLGDHDLQYLIEDVRLE